MCFRRARTPSRCWSRLKKSRRTRAKTRVHPSYSFRERKESTDVQPSLKLTKASDGQMRQPGFNILKGARPTRCQQAKQASQGVDASSPLPSAV